MVTTEQSYRKALILSLHCITTSDILRSETVVIQKKRYYEKETHCRPIHWLGIVLLRKKIIRSFRERIIHISFLMRVFVRLD